MIECANLAALKAGNISDGSAHLADPALEGIFFWTPGDHGGVPSTEIDSNVVKSNGAALSVGAWVRQSADMIQSTSGGTVQDVATATAGSPYAFGIIDDGFASDQTAKLNNWLQHCADNALSPYCPNRIRARATAPIVYAPPTADNYTHADVLLSNLSIRTSADTGFILGARDRLIVGAKIELPNVWRESLDWSGDAKAYEGGIIVNSMASCTVKLSYIYGFTQGLLLWAEKNYITYNSFYGGNIVDCRYARVLLTSRNAVNADDFINENSFYGTNIQLTSSSKSESGAVWGDVFTSIGNGYRGHNNNRFYSNTYQLADDVYGYASISSAIPVWFDGCGGNNTWFSPRWEGGKGPFGLCDSKANGDNAIYAINNQVLTPGYDGGTPNQQFRFHEIGGAWGNIYRGQYTKQTFWHSGPLRDAVSSYGPSGQARLKPPFFWTDVTSGARTRTISNQWAGVAHTDALMTYANNGAWIMVPVDRIKSLTVSSECVAGFGGRPAFQCFDANMDPLQGAVTDAYGTEKYIKFPGQTTTTAFGGAETVSEDNGSNSINVSIREEVKFVSIGVIAGTYPALTRGICISAWTQYNNEDLDKVETSIGVIDPLTNTAQAKLASANPGTSGTVGIWETGDVVWNASPASGQPMGWVCTTSGHLGQPYANSINVLAPGQIFLVGTNAYRAKSTGTTASSGAGPSGTALGVDQQDGTVTFQYIGTKAAFSNMANTP